MELILTKLNEAQLTTINNLRKRNSLKTKELCRACAFPLIFRSQCWRLSKTILFTHSFNQS